MKTKESLCVDCGLPCLKNGCPYYSVTVVYCDECGDYAMHAMDGQDLCEECAKKYVDGAWDDLSVSEKAEMLKIEHSTYE